MERMAAFHAVDWLSLIANGALYLALGIAFYRACERRAFQQGLLGQY